MTFVMCINNKRYRRRLKLHVVYKATPSKSGGWYLVDESGVQREYAAKYFSPVKLPPEGAALFDNR
jgi:hypothetical protein